MEEVVKFKREETRINDFLSLPKALYTKRTLMQNAQEERALLTGTHPLSGYFTLTPYLVYRDGQAAARGVLTAYPASSTAYFGFFECIRDSGCAKALFDAMKRGAWAGGFTQLLGPVNASFWIGYRLKRDNFDAPPYVGEPYNLDYYEGLLLENGFSVSARYRSNRFAKLPLFRYQKKKYRERYDAFAAKGYVIASSTSKSYDRDLREVYRLLMALYKNFPVFAPISEEDFLAYFSFYRRILDLSMVKIVYFQDQAVGFFIGVPDYGNLLYRRRSPLTLLRVLAKRQCSGRYVLLYMGVKPEHCGLGRAISHAIMKNLHRKNARSIGALIAEGKVTASYAQDSIEAQNEYTLYKTELKGQTKAKLHEG